MGKNLLGNYMNGNTKVMIFSDGTKIRMTNDDEWLPEKPESIDYKITNRCTGTNCAFCHEQSGPLGEHGDIMHDRFIETMLPYSEIAIGGGNVLEHPDLIPFLEKLKSLRIIASATFNQKHFMEHRHLIKRLSEEGMLYGIGISLGTHRDDPERLLEALSGFPKDNVVIHVINGVHTVESLSRFYDKGLKLLILGYKEFGRGIMFYKGFSDKIESSIGHLKDSLSEVLQRFNAVSFDNLAINQLALRDLLPEEEWSKFYMGGEGQFTMYVDSVRKEYAASSTSPSTERFPLKDDIADMFADIRRMSGYDPYENKKED